jgi:hypothetical protein
VSLVKERDVLTSLVFAKMELALSRHRGKLLFASQAVQLFLSEDLCAFDGV